MFALEALEPRRFLSAGDSVAEAIPIDVATGARITGRLEGPGTVYFSFDAQGGMPYIFAAQNYPGRMQVLAEDGQKVIADAEEDDFIQWTAPRTGKFFLSVFNNEWPD